MTIGPDYAAVYVLACSVTIEESATLTIESGAITKAASSRSLQVKGTLNAIGTAEEPITFTSVEDNSVGGSTGTGSPQAGDWEGIEAVGDGAIDIEQAKVRYAKTGVRSESEGPIVVKNVAFASQLAGAVAVVQEASAAPTLLNSSSVDSGANFPAFLLLSDSLDANRLGGNTATGNGIPVVQLAGAIGTSSALPAEPAPWMIGVITSWLLAGNANLDVPEGKTLTISPGAVLKGLGGQSGPCNSCSLSVKGTLNAIGTAEEPITFTSVEDNSVGGSTGTGSPQAGDWEGISFDDVASIKLSYLDIRYAAAAIDIQLLDSATITNSDFVYNDAAIKVQGTAENEPALGALPCVPPYLSFVTASYDWFGKNGYPAPDVDIASIVGTAIPSEYAPFFGAASSLASFSAPLFGGDNTIPFSIYSCPEIGIPPIPVTPVVVTETPTEPIFPDPEL